ncbi:MAG: hypothetical protein OEM63_01905 [Gammaproteobacteria bacterium]|nr:hypothetical protein [Gammaproteobacteria bacterium]
MMELIADGARFIHVLFGCVGLTAFWIPIFAKKGAVNHVRFGKIYVWSAYVVLAGAAIALTGRFSDLYQRGIGPEEQPTLFAFLVFLSYLTLVTFVTVRHGMQVLRHKGDPAAMRTGPNLALAYLSIAASASIILYGVILEPPNAILLFALSPIGLGVGSGNLRYLNNPPATQRGWMYEHLGAMLGGGIAFHTAFAVFGASRLFDIGLTGWVAVIPWVLPAAIGIPATFIWTRHYRRKFGEMGVAA